MIDVQASKFKIFFASKEDDRRYGFDVLSSERTLNLVDFFRLSNVARRNLKSEY